MSKEKKKMSDMTKVKLIYCGELLVIAIVFLVLGILRLLGVMGTSSTRRLIFNWVTLFGGAWIIIDFIWFLASKKRRAKNSLLDKCLNLPIAPYLITFNLMCLIGTQSDEFYNTGTAILFLYIFVNYTFQAVYHFFKPNPAMIEAAEEEETEAKEKEAETALNEIKEETEIVSESPDNEVVDSLKNEKPSE